MTGKGVLWSLIVGLMLFAGPGNAQPPHKDLTVQDIYLNIKLKADSLKKIEWMPAGKAVSFIKYSKENGEEQLWTFDAVRKKEKMILGYSDLVQDNASQKAFDLSLSGYQWYHNENGLLFVQDGDIFVYDFKSGKLSQMTNTEEPEENVKLSPDDRWISFVRKNNLYVLNINSGQETQLTFDGSDTILNGKKDWAYQEELGERYNFVGYWWSPDSKSIAFYHMNQSKVPLFPIVDYTPVHPEVDNMHYPKAGDPNAVVKIGVATVADGHISWMDFGDDTNVYFPRVYWLPDGKHMAVMRLDRLQQHLDFFFADIQTGKSRIVVSNSDPRFVEIYDFVYFFKDKNLFLWGSEKSGYPHIYLYDYQGNEIRQLTMGNWAVTDFCGVNEQKGWVYFVSTQKSILQRQLYRVDLDGRNMREITTKDGSHDITMAPGAGFYIDDYSNSAYPEDETIHSASGEPVYTLFPGAYRQLQPYDLPVTEFLEIKGEDGLTFHASITKPVPFNAEKKYPVIIYVYGGPHSQLVINRFGSSTSLWNTMMAQQGFIVFTLDNRGTANRGKEWEKSVYRQLGKLELQDQLTGVKYLKSLPFVDPDRIGIWGWSYGGYMTVYALTHSGEFKAGAAVAPVTSWRFYDSIYTERYMGLPSDNEEGYQDSSPLYQADSLKGHLFLAHGTGDINVHFQNTIDLLDPLIQSGKDFQLHIFPNQSHSILSTADRENLFGVMTRFFKENL